MKPYYSIQIERYIQQQGYITYNVTLITVYNLKGIFNCRSLLHHFRAIITVYNLKGLIKFTGLAFMYLNGYI